METSLNSSGGEPPGDSHRRTLLLSVLCGAVGGYFLLHPYAMIVYRFYETSSPQRSIAAGGMTMDTLSGVCHPDMLPMGIPFALLGGVAGAFFGLWLIGKNRKVEAEKKIALVEGVRQLMVTLAHHLLNSAAGIGGLADLFLRKEQDERKKSQLEIMKKEAVRIEAVVKSLQSLKIVTSERYIGSSETLMIDIRKELEERLK
jgi:signal transduction histidine kinase